MMRALETARDALGAISGIASCRIGFEAAVSPADYPLVRLVPERIVPGKPYFGRTCQTLVYLSMPTAEAEGLEEVYADLFELERQVLRVLKDLQARYIETLWDRDELRPYKMIAIRCDIADTLAREFGASGAAAAQAATVSGSATETPL